MRTQDFKGDDIQMSQRPIAQGGSSYRSDDSASGPWWNPRYWRKRIWAAVAVLLLILVVVIPVAVTQTQSSAYPNYSELSYTLRETCKGSIQKPRAEMS